MSEPVQVQFLGKNWEEGPWIVPNSAGDLRWIEPYNEYGGDTYVVKD